MSVTTVLGEVKAELLSLTLTHEHFSLNFSDFCQPPPSAFANKFTGEITLENVGAIRQYPYSSEENLRLSGADVERAVLEEVLLFREHGGGTVVENTSHGLGRNLGLMARVSQQTGVHVVAGTGHYCAQVQSAATLATSVECLSDLMRTELTVGCPDSPHIRCGFIGEVGSTWPIHLFERRCIEATAVVQREVGCAVSFHPGRDAQAPPEIMRLFTEAGGDPRRTVMSHLDRTFSRDEELLDFAELGCFCQLDLFGMEVSFYQLAPSCDMPSDAERCRRVSLLVSEGRCDQVLLSHDIHTRHRLSKFGGHGLSHIPVTVARQLITKGLSQLQLTRILNSNPAAWLTGKRLS